MDEAGAGGAEAACTDVERVQLRYVVDVQPVAASLPRVLCCHAHEIGADALPLQVPADFRVDQERVVRAVPGDVDEPCNAAVLHASDDPAQAVRANPVPPSRIRTAAVGLDQRHHLCVRDRAAPLVLDRRHHPILAPWPATPALSWRRGHIAGLVVAWLLQPVFGALPAPFATTAVVVGLLALAVGGTTTALLKVSGPAGTFAAAVALLVFGNATSTGILPAQYLPDWLEPMTGILPVGVAVRALRGAAYFHNDGVASGVLVLAAWAFGAALLFAAGELVQRRRQHAHEVTGA